MKRFYHRDINKSETKDESERKTNLQEKPPQSGNIVLQLVLGDPQGLWEDLMGLLTIGTG